MTDLSRRQLLQAGAGMALAAYGLSGCTVERHVDQEATGQQSSSCQYRLPQLCPICRRWASAAYLMMIPCRT